jgi:hypothetical protein
LIDALPKMREGRARDRLPDQLDNSIYRAHVPRQRTVVDIDIGTRGAIAFSLRMAGMTAGNSAQCCSISPARPTASRPPSVVTYAATGTSMGAMGTSALSPAVSSGRRPRVFLFYGAPGSSRAWTNAKRQLAFAVLTQDGDVEGVFFLDRLLTAVEAAIIRSRLGVAKARSVSEKELVRRPEWASDNRPVRTKFSSTSPGPASFAPESVQGENSGANPPFDAGRPTVGGPR